MRKNIFQFDQSVLCSLNISTDEALLLDYLYLFFNYKLIKKSEDDGTYFYISYNKIVSDLPILGKDAKGIKRMMRALEQKGILKRKVEKGRQLFVKPNTLLLALGNFETNRN